MLQMIGPLIFMVIAMYLLWFRPQQKKAREVLGIVFDSALQNVAAVDFRGEFGGDGRRSRR